MSGFSDTQLKALRGKLPGRHVRTRRVGDSELSYIEGWFAIAEANRIFGFDAWHRETVDLTCLWQGRFQGQASCSYSARVRVTVEAGESRLVREGCGFGTGSGMTPGEAHEKALKEAETDAMKRALVTFGNRFGLALYDREQRGVSAQKTKPAPEVPWSVLIPGQTAPTLCPTSHEVFSELRKHLERATTPAQVQALWQRNETMLKMLRDSHRELVDRNGVHYTSVFATLCRNKAQQLTESAPSQASVDKSQLAIGEPRRNRNKDHLRFVAGHPCLVCGRQPAHAHHLTFIQPHARGLKASDEWTVPLCVIHHRELHDRGHELSFWQAHKLDPKAAAEALWARSKGEANGEAEEVSEECSRAAVGADEASGEA